MTYVDGFVLPIKKKNTVAYRKMATEASRTWKRFGALRYYECMGDDLNPKAGGAQITTFAKLVKTKPGETVWFSFIIYKSRAHRDAVNKKVMAYYSKKYKDKKHHDMPFDMRRMAYGGFKTLVEQS